MLVWETDPSLRDTSGGARSKLILLLHRRPYRFGRDAKATHRRLKSCRLQLFRGERWDSNPRPPGPQPEQYGASECRFGALEPFERRWVALSCAHSGPRGGP